MVMIKDYPVTEEELELIRRSMEVNNNNQEHLHYQNHDDTNDIYNENGTGDLSGLCMKVMTDEQIEVLRKQIAAYATLTQQLADMHKYMAAQQDLTAGISLTPPCRYYCVPLCVCVFFFLYGSLLLVELVIGIFR